MAAVAAEGGEATARWDAAVQAQSAARGLLSRNRSKKLLATREEQGRAVARERVASQETLSWANQTLAAEKESLGGPSGDEWAQLVAKRGNKTKPRRP